MRTSLNEGDRVYVKTYNAFGNIRSIYSTSRGRMAQVELESQYDDMITVSLKQLERTYDFVVGCRDGENYHGDCFAYGSINGCDEDCPVYQRGECEFQEEFDKNGF